MRKRILSLFLAVIMVFSMMVLPASATEVAQETEVAADYCQHCKQTVPADQWIPWSVTDTGPRTGHYYLDRDITNQTSQITINLDDDLLRTLWAVVRSPLPVTNPMPMAHLPR